MSLTTLQSGKRPSFLPATAFLFALPVFLFGWPAPAQQPAPKPPVAPQAASPAAAPAGTAFANEPGNITEEQLRQLLEGKTFYLRGGYLDNTLTFNEHGGLSGRSPQGSYTLSLIQIERVRLVKHKVELEGIRYGLHFLGALPYEDPANAFDRVRITPKKKLVRITIDREQVVKPKKIKPEKHKKGEPAAPAQPSDADQLKAEIAAVPEAERPAEPGSVTTTTSPAHAAKLLMQALDTIFAPTLDARMMAAMPEFWKLYYQAVAAKTDFRPSDPAVLRQSAVDRKARLLTSFEPDSNQFAQDAGVAGMALYYAVIGPDGKPGEIAVGRPIGFGLDENAVAAIRNAKFEPAIKDGKPVSVVLDLVVQFRIFSKRTAVAGPPAPAGQPAAAPSLPGPYSLPPH